MILKNFIIYSNIKQNLKIVGLMCIPPINEEPHKNSNAMAILRDEFKSNLKLSMGMSNDYNILLYH